MRSANSFTQASFDSLTLPKYLTSASDGAKVFVQSEPGLIFVGPGYEKHCIPRHVLHLSFNQKNGLSGVVRSRTREGLPVELTVDVEYRFSPDGLEAEGLARTGFENYNERLLMTARAEIRNSASNYQGVEFLRGSRETIAVDMLQRLTQTLVNRDKVFVELMRVS